MKWLVVACLIIGFVALVHSEEKTKESKEQNEEKTEATEAPKRKEHSEFKKPKDLKEQKLPKDCVPSKCPKVPKHYEELGCKPVIAENECCPERFICPNIDAYDNERCYYKGKGYEKNSDLPSELRPPCVPVCKCGGYGDRSSFNCATVDCPHTFDVSKAECLHQYTFESCCPVKYICEKEEMEALETCYVDGKMFREGQTMYPKEEPCSYCICQKGFDNSTAYTSNKMCKKVDCNIELRSIERFHEGCVPVYLGANYCCPIDWRCPKEDEEIIAPLAKSIKDSTDEKLKCKFGNSTLAIGEGLKNGDKCLECLCSVPPMVHCMKNPDCPAGN